METTFKHETKAERILGLFRLHKQLNGEQVTKHYEEAYGRETLSNCTHTTVSKLTKEGYLRQIEGGSKTEAGLTVDLWELIEGDVVVTPSIVVYKKSPKALQADIDLLERINASKDQQINDLINKLEIAHDEIAALKKAVR